LALSVASDATDSCELSTALVDAVMDIAFGAGNYSLDSIVVFYEAEAGASSGSNSNTAHRLGFKLRQVQASNNDGILTVVAAVQNEAEANQAYERLSVAEADGTLDQAVRDVI